MEIKELGHVVFYVSDLKKSADFYRDILGFREISREGWVAVFSSERTHHELLLIEIGGPAGKKEQTIKPGLYHVGFKIGDSKEDIQKAYKELKEKGVKIIGTGDHGVTHSIYIYDPDENEIELYADVSDKWKKDPKAIIQATKPLDLG